MYSQNLILLQGLSAISVQLGAGKPTGALCMLSIHPAATNTACMLSIHNPDDVFMSSW